MVLHENRNDIVAVTADAVKRRTGEAW